MEPAVRAQLLAEGKTKRIWGVGGSTELVIVENKDDITAFDDPSYTRQFGSKARCATKTTCRVFELLRAAGIPVAYRRQLSETEFLADRCAMLPLEVIGRRYAAGSFLQRHPELSHHPATAPYRFSTVKFELFLKTTRGKLVFDDDLVIVDGLDPQKGEEDPLIRNPFDAGWRLSHPKKPLWLPDADLGRVVPSGLILGKSADGPKALESLLRQTFLVLEAAWSMLGYRLVDLKIELGLTAGHRPAVADVIDNDSWRLRDTQWRELSKQAFRDGEDIAEVERKYGFVAGLVERFRIPRQAVVLWRASTEDQFPKWSYVGAEQVEVTMSGHKSTRACLRRLAELEREYPDGGVIIAVVGRSNGLAPILATHTTWPVVAVPATLKEFPEDIWSSIRMPSATPVATVGSADVALDLACNILAARNPLLYMERRLAIEQLDAE